MTHVISGRMTRSEVADILRQHQCREFTEGWTFVGPGQTIHAGGGWADVFKARTTSGLLIAIKRTRLFTSQIEFPRILRQSANELHIWSKCDHPNVLPLLGFAELDGQFAMISPWMDGGDVRAFIQENPNTPNRLNMCLQIANGLQYFHENLMVHGDLKAQNALVAADGTVMLTDLGSSTIKNQSLTVSTMERGMTSIYWMAPEITRLREPAPLSSSSDVYALGMTLLEIITGAYPFSDWTGSDEALRMRLFYPQPGGEPLLPARLTCCFPDTQNGNDLWELITSCWAQVPHERPEASLVKQRLGSIGLDQPTTKGSHSERPFCYPVCATTDITFT